MSEQQEVLENQDQAQGATVDQNEMDQHIQEYQNNPEKLKALYLSHQETLKQTISRKEKLREERAKREELENRLNALEEESKKAKMDAEERQRYEQEQKQKLAEDLESKITRLKRENEELALLNVFSRSTLHDPKDALDQYFKLSEDERKATAPDAYIDVLKQQKAYLFKQENTEPAAHADEKPAKPVTPTTSTPVVPGTRERIDGRASIPTAPKTRQDLKILDKAWAELGQ